MNKPKIGDTLYRVNIGNAARREKSQLHPCTVAKVGRKYFTTVDVNNDREANTFHIDGWWEKTEYPATSKLFASAQAFHDEKERNDLARKLSRHFRYINAVQKTPLNVLREIAKLLNLQDDE